jgi:ATP-dependent Clp protease ATP-binding subunit ClpA
VYLSDAIVIMTSNLGSEHFRKLTSPLGFRSGGVGIELVAGDVRRELERRFPPEFLNRVDEVVLFSPLTHDEAREIAKHYLEQVTLTLAKSQKTVHIDDDALDAIVTEGHSLAFGARFLKRVIDERVKLPISVQWRDSSHFRVRVHDGLIVVDVAARHDTDGGAGAYGHAA